MDSSNSAAKTATQLGGLLRHWRSVRGKSHLDLSLDTGISQKQISFVESGRCVPTRQTLMTLAQTLDVPLRERNILLLAAGYAPVFSESAWDSLEMKSITGALQRILRQHEPFPAVVMDRYWNVLMTNECAPRFFNCFCDMRARASPRNLLHLMFDPTGMRPYIANWDNVAKSLFERVYRESVGRIVDENTKELLATLLTYPDVTIDWKNPVTMSFVPVIPISFIKHDQVLNYFSMVTTVGTPQTVAAQELRIECMFPADDETEIRHVALMESVRV